MTLRRLPHPVKLIGSALLGSAAVIEELLRVGGDAPPQVGHAQFFCPSRDVRMVQRCVDCDHARGIGELPLRIAGAPRPFQFRKHGVLGGHDRDVLPGGPFNDLSSRQLLAAKRTIAPNNQIDLAGVRGFNDVE